MRRGSEDSHQRDLSLQSNEKGRRADRRVELNDILVMLRYLV